MVARRDHPGPGRTGRDPGGDLDANVDPGAAPSEGAAISGDISPSGIAPPRQQTREQRLDRKEHEKAVRKAARLEKRKADPKRAAIGRALTLVGLLGLILLLLCWFVWLSPPERIPRALLILIVVGPLLLPLRGILHGRRYTHQWVGFLAMAYFAGGIDAWANHGTSGPWPGIATTVLATSLFVGSVMVARYTASESTT